TVTAAAAATAAADGIRSQRVDRTTGGTAARLAQRDAATGGTVYGTNADIVPTVYGTAYAVLAHGRSLSMTPLVDRSRSYVQRGSLTPLVVSSGAAFYYDELRNLNGSSTHSPGPRAAASLVALPFRGLNNTDTLLFGGLTAVNRTPNNPAGLPLLTNDVHYLQFIPAVEMVAAAAAAAATGTAAELPPARFPPCPFSVSNTAAAADGSSSSGSPCKSASPLKHGGTGEAAADMAAAKPPPPVTEAPP
ncbi:hypothetical protein Vafri_18054, partial [Volvox africanus]